MCSPSRGTGPLPTVGGRRGDATEATGGQGGWTWSCIPTNRDSTHRARQDKAMPALLVAEANFTERVGRVVANDARRTSFTVQSGGTLFALSGTDLSVLATWPVDPKSRSTHASLPDKGFAL